MTFNGHNLEPLEPRRLLSTTRIMPLGDSITEASSVQVSYRYWLWNTLRGTGYRDVDFVGSMHGISGSVPASASFDQDHEGHSGWTANQLRDRVTAWANSYHPDVVLLHAGTNDIRAGQSVSGTVAELGQIIERLRTANRRVTVLLCTIIPNAAQPSATSALNDSIPDLVDRMTRPESRVMLVDQAGGFDVNRDTFDGLHPNQTGAKKMASRFYEALREVLPRPAAPAPTPGTTFLSSLNFSTVENGMGPVELDRSAGGASAGDGRTMSIRGRKYSYGLGVAASSRIEFRLDGKQRYFASDLGIDDETRGAGSVVFKVYADGKRIFSSRVITGTDPLESVRLSIKGVRKLVLIVSDAADGNRSDHANWANACVLA